MDASLRLGFPAALGAYLIWGSLPLYIRAMDHISAFELLAHRVIWSAPTAIGLIAAAANWRDVKAVFTGGKLKWLALSGVLIGSNWAIYIWAIHAEKAIEASLGYYINPLVNVLFGMLFFAERLRVAQWVAVAIAATGVAVMAIGFGHVPWAALALCVTFAFYSVIRKKVLIDSRVGFLVEVAMLAPLAGAWLVWFASTQPGGRWMGAGGWDIVLLVASGPITAFPLILFALAAKRLNLSTLGMMQYIGPTLQFLIAVFIFKEAFTMSHAVAFGCIWTALLIFTGDGLWSDARARWLAGAARPV